jgi:hypothetical protein
VNSCYYLSRASKAAQLFFTPNWSLLAKFDGGFASGSLAPMSVYGGEFN